ncbi:bacillithiol system redox-active protein YtxJ [Rossellomorea yichunensis]|uniref:bacillithiol system redox-active protein YtxJ n=1 Tax=Rossellomorea yichunensis TaxID=3077331 RepID=UPI0028DD8259|nr:bacillithiol system redox-active protein YtxJ [Rossellomorea sp. YC4-1]MDT9024988.1 bacillithiol system redox-active protein YtxJ [Rossellomorea sp. YC4-1]
MQKIETVQEFEQLSEKNSRFFFMKHSLTCPVSSNAFSEYQAFLNKHEEEDGYYLAVQESRELSNHIAEKYGIKHESPQAFLFIEGKPGWNASHWNITENELNKL